MQNYKSRRPAYDRATSMTQRPIFLIIVARYDGWIKVALEIIFIPAAEG